MQLATKILLLSGITLYSTVVFSFLFFNTILKFGIKDQTSLRKRNEMRDLYVKLPFPLTFKLYFFNVTNPDGVTQGEKPILKEVGPYAYDEYVSKTEIVESNADDTLAYNSFDLFVYNPQKSHPDVSQDDYVTILHPVIVGAVTQAVRDSPQILSILAKAINSIFNKPSSMYLTDKVRNILFEGMSINCTVTDFSSKAVCSQLKTLLPGVRDEKGILKFSFLGSRNQTLGPRVKVKRGIQKSKDLGRLVEFKEEKQLTLWGSKECNKFRGTDGWIFPPFLTREEGIWSFSPDLCRNILASFVEERHIKGAPTDLFEADLGDQQNVQEDKCYCPTEKTCLPKGLFDLSKCMGVPLLATFPHFYKAESRFLDTVVGLNPEPEKHALYIFFERMTGAPIRAFKRLQFNIMVKPNAKISQMSNIPEALHPIMWLEESVELEGKFLRKITSIFLVIKLNKSSRWIFLFGSLGGLGASFFLYYQNRHKGTITPIHLLHKVMGKKDKVEFIPKPNTVNVKSGDQNNDDEDETMEVKKY